jgi:cytochrome P450
VKAQYPGQLFRRLRQDPLSLLSELASKHTEACRLNILGREVWVLFEPALVQRVLCGDQRSLAKGKALQRTQVLLGNGLLTAEGADHLRQRRTLQPAFHKRRLEGYARTMVDCSESLSRRVVDGQLFDAHKAMMDLALGIVSRTVLGANLEAHHSRIGEALERVLGQFGLLTMPFFELFQHLPLPPMRRFRQSRDELFAVVDEIVDLHARGQTSPDCMLSLLEHVEPVRVKDEVLTMLLAGHETTANLLTFAIDLLARHPGQAEPFYREVRTLLNGRRAEVSDYNMLTVTRRVIQEALRLYPPAWVVGRRTLGGVDIGPYRAPADTLLLAPQCVIQRDDRHFPNPHDFLPERWLSADPEPYAFFPFGGGTRMCIGEGFARMEAVLALATLARDWTFHTVNSGPPLLSTGITLRPRHGLPIIAKRVS